MKRMAFFVVSFVVLLILADSASAIPAFARKYGYSCNVCHSPAPRLKPFGDEFSRNGFKIPGKEPPRFVQATGDDHLLLMRDFPVAMRFELYGTYTSKSSTSVDMQSPLLLKFLSGGQIANDVAYYFYFFFSERGTVAGIEDAFIMFNDIGNIDFDFYFGQFQLSDPLFKRELRLELQDYRIYSTEIGASAASLTYDRGVMLTYKAPTGTGVALEVLNGNGIGAPIAEAFDIDKYKNYLLRISQDVIPEFRLGIFGYTGKQKPVSIASEFLMWGPDLTLDVDRFQLNVQYVARTDGNPDFLPVAPSSKVKTDGGFAELIFSPDYDKSRWYATLLYNKVNSDYPGVDYQSITGNYTYLLATNFRLTGEYTYETITKTSSVAVGFFSAF
ncbi:MAG: hypothetical protein M1378_10650 [Bacteroidetes bacterium]|nr:hypothetical protein [Bacteroidota bacterium]